MLKNTMIKQLTEEDPDAGDGFHIMLWAFVIVAARPIMTDGVE